MGVHKVSAFHPFIFQKSGKSIIIRNLAVPRHFVAYLGANSGQLPAPVRTLPSTSHCHRLFPFLRLFIGFDPIDLSFLKKIWNANGGHGKALQR
jgi:hypothetical protein